MGLSTAGMAFKLSSSTLSEQAIVHLAFGENFVAVPDADVSKGSDIRRAGNIALESTHGALFVYSGDVAEKFLFDLDVPDPSFFDALGNPETVMVFCHYDSGDSFGYRIFENGLPVRRRLYTGGETIDEGTPKGFEIPWLHAEQLFEEENEPPFHRNQETGDITHEAGVTAALLRISMEEYFGICPWDEWNYKTTFNHYQLKLPSETSETSDTSGAPAKQAWWRRIW